MPSKKSAQNKTPMVYIYIYIWSFMETQPEWRSSRETNLLLRSPWWVETVADVFF